MSVNFPLVVHYFCSCLGFVVEVSLLLTDIINGVVFNRLIERYDQMFQCEASSYIVHEMNASSGISPHNLQNIHRLKLISRMNSKKLFGEFIYGSYRCDQKGLTVDKVIGLRLESGVSISGLGRDFFPGHNVLDSLGLSSSGRCTEDCFPGVKRLERDDN